MAETTTDFAIENAIAVVTGGGSGIGLAFSRLLQTRGARVLIADLKLSPEAQSWVKCNACTPQAVFQHCDVTNWAHLESLPAKAKELWGSVPDIWVPGAGIFEPPWSHFFLDSDASSNSSHYASVSINIEHPVRLTRIAIRSMLSGNKRGVVLNIGSDAGIDYFYSVPLYTATKHAIVAFTRSLGPVDAEEGIKVVAICPGSVLTPLFTTTLRDQWNVKEENALLPEEVATAMVELVESSEYPGGSIVRVDKERGMRLIPWPQSEAPPDMSGEDMRQELERNYAPVRQILRRERSAGYGRTLEQNCNNESLT
ncbi:hypothetical protein ASPSYDRAFT_206475 [Aspergillus sydowii CBS 593.65]|uniref:Uncharacterized protein n=1 Tax=Aspergillus sydowii CBS 593.65 TaxID=1036612 RepID=A0A1L9TCX6_9EURO|nr:uncharacterized protein ASPSYDRAFT_206475 [Aspergillus sydowii CBS 593.65]OJJ57266.1 hypothetical protein ASPSYDRAFT_206475 [Aspergillus sydowii CBS 593.65]